MVATGPNFRGGRMSLSPAAIPPAPSGRSKKKQLRHGSTCVCMCVCECVCVSLCVCLLTALMSCELQHVRCPPVLGAQVWSVQVCIFELLVQCLPSVQVPAGVGACVSGYCGESIPKFDCTFCCISGVVRCRGLGFVLVRCAVQVSMSYFFPHVQVFSGVGELGLYNNKERLPTPENT